MPEERKLATVLFADIVGSTTLAAEHDPERIRALFGVPVAHDDDAQRAVRSALAIREETAAFEPAARLELTLRIGVNTGDVIASLNAGDQNLETAVARLQFARFLLQQRRAAEARDQLEGARSVLSDPLAFRRRNEIDALLRECDAVRALE